MTTKALATHTPGPWDVTEIGTIEDQSHNPVQIASVSPRNREANARLMAAAPDLLKALQKLSLWCDENINGVPTELARIQELADDAILKAKGKP